MDEREIQAREALVQISDQNTDYTWVHLAKSKHRFKMKSNRQLHVKLPPISDSKSAPNQTELFKAKQVRSYVMLKKVTFCPQGKENSRGKEIIRLKTEIDVEAVRNWLNKRQWSSKSHSNILDKANRNNAILLGVRPTLIK